MVGKLYRKRLFLLEHKQEILTIFHPQRCMKLLISCSEQLAACIDERESCFQLKISINYMREY